MASTSTPRRIAAAVRLAAVGAVAAGMLGAVAPASADTTTPPPPPGRPGQGPPGGPGGPGSFGPFLAIAWSPDNGDHGWANNKDTELEARQAALGYCQQYGGNQCQVVVVSKECGALFAATPDQNGQSNGHKWGPAHTGTGSTPDAAQNAAVAPGGIPVEATGIPLIIRCATGNAGQG